MTGRPLRVVLVEDDLRVARVNRDLLESDGSIHVVGTAGNCGEGRQLVAHLHPDLVLLDVYLPDGSGLELLREWRSGGAHFEVIMVTAAHDVHSVQDAVHHGALDYLIKPFDRDRLADAISRFRTRRRVSAGSFDQQRLDRYLGVSDEPRGQKGIDTRTLERVAQHLRDTDQARSAEEVGSGVGLSRVTAWRYLESLVASGRAEVEFSYGATGRPSKLYRTRE